MKELREDKLTVLDLSFKRLGPAEGIVIAKLVEGTAVLKKCDVRGNRLGKDGDKKLRDAVKKRKGFELLV